MKIDTLRRKADTLGLQTETAKLTGGDEGLFISLEKVVDGRARCIDKTTETKLFRYLKRYKIAYEYQGNCTGLLIKSK